MSEDINLDGYTEEKLKFNMIWVNIFAIIVIIFAILIFGVPFYIIWPELINFSSGYNQNIEIQTRIINIIFALMPLFVGFLIHELIHGIFYAIYAKNGFKSIKIGLKLKYGVAYCICNELIKIKNCIIVLLMPTIILGFIPAILSIVIGSYLLLFYGILFIGGGTGDFLVIIRLLKENKEDYFLDLFGPEKYSFIYRKTKE